jgi:excisionase family DNA binding protein
MEGHEMSALAAEIRAAVREALREELSRLLAEALPTAPRMGEQQLMGVDEAAAHLGLSTSTVYKLAERVELPSTKIGRRLLFRVADLDAYAEARRRSPERVRELVAVAARKP